MAGLLLIHDLYPVPLEERVAEALDTVRPYMESHGGDVELLGIEDGVAQLRLEGSCKRAGVVVDARAGGAAGARGGRARPRGHGRGGRGRGGRRRERRSPARRCRCADGGSAALAQPGRSGASRAALVATGRSTACRSWSRTWTARCSPTATRCADCGGALDGGALDAGALACPGCGRSFFLPQAGRSLDDDHLQLEPVPLLREDEAIKVALSKTLDEAVAGRRRALMVSGLRGLARARSRRRRRRAPDAGERCDLCGRACPTTTGTCSTSTSGRSCASCESCWALRSGDPEFRPAGTRTLWLEDFELPEEIWAQFRIPIGLAFFMHSSVTELRGGALPEPGRRHRERARTSRPGAGSSAMNPVLRRPRARRRGADRQPHGRPAAVRDRADRPLLHAGRAGQGRPGRGSPAARAWSRRSTRYFAELREAVAA